MARWVVHGTAIWNRYKFSEQSCFAPFNVEDNNNHDDQGSFKSFTAAKSGFSWKSLHKVV